MKIQPLEDLQSLSKDFVIPSEWIWLDSLLHMITHKYRGSQQFSRVDYSTQIYWFNTRGAKEYSQLLAAELSIQPHLET